MIEIELPSNWQTKKLGEVCEVVTGTTPPKSDMTNYGNEIPFFKPPHLWDNLIHTTEEKLSLNGAKKARVVPPNTVLVTCIGNLGRTGFVKKEAAFNQQINAILENEKLIGKYLFYQAQSPSFRNQLERLATGTTVSIVNKKNFETIEIPVPPLETQHAIVSKIEELFSELDQGIADLKTAQAQLKVYRQSVLKHAFEGNKFKKNNLRKLKDITSKIGSGSTPKGGSDSYFDSGIPLVRSLNIHFECIKYKGLAFIDNKQAEKLKNVIINENDVLLNITGASIGRVNIAPKEFHNGRVNQHVSIIRPKNNSFLPKYLKYFIQTSEIQNWISNANYGVTRQALTKSMLENLEVPLPPIEEQHLIVQEIESRLSVADKMEESIQESLQKAEALRQSILKKAFSGELV